DVMPERVGRLHPVRTPDGAHRIAGEGDVAEFLERRQTGRFGIIAALDPLLHADRHVAADLFVEFLVSGVHRYPFPSRAGFITRPIASTTCAQRSRSPHNWAFPAGVAW